MLQMVIIGLLQSYEWSLLAYYKVTNGNYWSVTMLRMVIIGLFRPYEWSLVTLYNVIGMPINDL
jgi:hypothetical protein